MKLTTNFYSGGFFLLVAVALWLLVPSQIVTSNTELLNSRFFPRIISLILGLASLGLIIQSLFIPQKPSDKRRSNEFRVLCFLGLLVGYVILFKVIGFLFTSLIMGPLFLLFFKQKRIWYFVYVAIAAVAVNFIFVHFLNVPLP